MKKFDYYQPESLKEAYGLMEKHRGKYPPEKSGSDPAPRPPGPPRRGRSRGPSPGSCVVRRSAGKTPSWKLVTSASTADTTDAIIAQPIISFIPINNDSFK